MSFQFSFKHRWCCWILIRSYPILSLDGVKDCHCFNPNLQSPQEQLIQYSNLFQLRDFLSQQANYQFHARPSCFQELFGNQAFRKQTSWVLDHHHHLAQYDEDLYTAHILSSWTYRATHIELTTSHSTLSFLMLKLFSLFMGRYKFMVLLPKTIIYSYSQCFISWMADISQCNCQFTL